MSIADDSPVSILFLHTDVSTVLDDNTYTNKTWAEVSGITVKEIHVMEVEFLSNMRYSLMVTKVEWEDWLKKLAKFWHFCDRAMTAPASPLLIPAARNYGSPLPSPTGIQQLTAHVPPILPSTSTYSPSTTAYASNGLAWPTSYHDSVIVSPLAAKPDLKNSFGKRYLSDDDPTEPPPKRLSVHMPSLSSLPSQTASQAMVQSQPMAMSVPEPLRLPAPQLTLNTAPHTQPSSGVGGAFSAPSYAPQTQSALSLPPLVPGVRAMVTVYSNAPTTVPSQLPILTTSGPSLTPSSTMAHGGASTPTSYVPTVYGTPTKRTSPSNTLNPATAYATSSPMSENFPHVPGVHTPLSHSPSIYLQQRSSPYKPIRSVNTLLYPPVSTSLQGYHLSGAVLPPNQMHYQPLGRRNEFRTGIVPEFQGVPYGGAVERGLALTPVHGSYMPTSRGHMQGLPAPYPN